MDNYIDTICYEILYITAAKLQKDFSVNLLLCMTNMSEAQNKKKVLTIGGRFTEETVNQWDGLPLRQPVFQEKK